MAQTGHGTHGAHGGSEAGHGSLKEYVLGFALSIILTIIPIAVVLNGWLQGTAAHVVLLGTAALQFLIQLLFFMHLREEKGPRYNLLTLLLGITVVITVVVGSLWIMSNNRM